MGLHDNETVDIDRTRERLKEYTSPMSSWWHAEIDRVKSATVEKARDLPAETTEEIIDRSLLVIADASKHYFESNGWYSNEYDMNQAVGRTMKAFLIGLKSRGGEFGGSIDEKDAKKIRTKLQSNQSFYGVRGDELDLAVDYAVAGSVVSSFFDPVMLPNVPGIAGYVKGRVKSGSDCYTPRHDEHPSQIPFHHILRSVHRPIFNESRKPIPEPEAKRLEPWLTKIQETERSFTQTVTKQV